MSNRVIVRTITIKINSVQKMTINEQIDNRLIQLIIDIRHRNITPKLRTINDRNDNH